MGCYLFLQGLSFNSTEKLFKKGEAQNCLKFLITINFAVNIVIRHQLKPLKCSFISTNEAIETFHYPMFDCAKFKSQWSQ